MLADVVVVLALHNVVLAVQVPKQCVPGVKLHVTLHTRHLWASDVALTLQAHLLDNWLLKISGNSGV